MSAITVSGDLLHYEVLGRGRPVVLLHSWLGSWRYWIPTMQQLSVKYRIYAIDMWGFGDSGKNKQFYHIEGQAQLLEQFLERMGITKAVFIGHGLGAAVLSHFVTRPNCGQLVHRMMLISPPLFGSGFRNTSVPTITPPEPPKPVASAEPEKPTATNFTFTVSASDDAPTVARLSDNDRAALMKAAAATGVSETLPLSDLTSDSKAATTSTPDEATSSADKAKSEDAAPASSEPPKPTTTQEVVATGANNPVANMVQRMKPVALLNRHVDSTIGEFERLRVEIEKADEEAIRVSSLSLSQYNPLQKLLKTPSPTLALFGSNDTFIQTPDETILETVASHERIRLLVLQSIRHFPMLEDSARFTRLLKEFLEAPDLQQIEMKDEWKRRLR